MVCGPGSLVEWVLEVLVAFAVCLSMTPKLPGHRGDGFTLQCEPGRRQLSHSR